MYLFGRNDKYSYPLHCGPEWMITAHSVCGYCTDDGALNYKEAMYRVNDNEYEPIPTAVMRPPGKMYCNVLKIPNEGVLN